MPKDKIEMPEEKTAAPAEDDSYGDVSVEEALELTRPAVEGAGTDKPISEAFIENIQKNHEQKAADINLHKDDIAKIVRNYVFAISLMRKQLDEAWLPLLKEGKINMEMYVGSPKEYTEAEWRTKVSESDRMVKNIMLLMKMGSKVKF